MKLTKIMACVLALTISGSFISTVKAAGRGAAATTEGEIVNLIAEEKVARAQIMKDEGTLRDITEKGITKGIDGIQSLFSSAFRVSIPNAPVSLSTENELSVLGVMEKDAFQRKINEICATTRFKHGYMKAAQETMETIMLNIMPEIIATLTLDQRAKVTEAMIAPILENILRKVTETPEHPIHRIITINFIVLPDESWEAQFIISEALNEAKELLKAAILENLEPHI